MNDGTIYFITALFSGPLYSVNGIVYYTLPGVFLLAMLEIRWWSVLVVAVAAAAAAVVSDDGVMDLGAEAGGTLLLRPALTSFIFSFPVLPSVTSP